MATQLTPQKMCVNLWSSMISPTKAKQKCKGGKVKIQKAITSAKTMKKKISKLKVPLQKCTESLMKKGSPKAAAKDYCAEVLKIKKPKVHGDRNDVKVCAGMRRQDDKSLSWSMALHLCQGARAKKYIQSREGINKPIGKIFPEETKNEVSNISNLANVPKQQEFNMFEEIFDIGSR